MLNGVDPIILFQFKKLLPLIGLEALPKIPVVANAGSSSFPLPFIPIYLSESLTGIYIDSENKSIDIDTTIDALSSGDAPVILQRAISSTVKIEMKAKKDSIGISLLAALTDLIIPKVTSKEYTITYLHGAVTVFDGLLHSFQISQESNTDLYNVVLELVRQTTPKLPIPIVIPIAGTVPL